MAIDRCLVDTNVLLRLSRNADPHYQFVSKAVSRLVEEGAVLHFTLQNIAELWNVMTRPVARNGFGFSVGEADQQVRIIETGMSLLPDSYDVYREWRSIVRTNNVSGVQVHDARLVASMYVHRLTWILTLNASDFSRFKDIQSLHPADVK